MATSTPNLLANISGKLTLLNLELQTGLKFNIDGVLNTIKRYCMPNESMYAAILGIIIYGYDAINSSWTIPGSDTVLVTPDFYNWFVDQYIKENGLEKVLKSSPAGSKTHLQNIGADGSFSRLCSKNAVNMMTGPSIHSPCFALDLLNKIHPKMVEEIENACNYIRTRAYLTLPADCFGGISQAMWFVTGAINSCYQGIIEIYQGMQLLMQQFFTWMNGIFKEIQKWIMSVIEQYIPLDFICLILDTVQVLLDDIGFFAQLFGGSANLFNVLNSIQTVVNYASMGVNFLYDPIGNLGSLFPNQAGQVQKFMSQIQDFPQAYMGKLIQHIGFGNIANNQGLAIANSIVQRYGLGAQLGPLGNMLATAGPAPNKSNWFRSGGVGMNQSGSGYAYSYTIPTVTYISTKANKVTYTPEKSKKTPNLDINLQPINWTGARPDDFKNPEN